MELALYSRSRENCKADTSKEALTARVVLMYANRFSICNFFSEGILQWIERDKWSERFYVTMFEIIYCKDEPGGNNEPGSCFAVLKEARQLRHIKHKDKAMLVLHQKLESILKSVRADVIRWFEYYMDQHRMKPMLSFIDEGVFVPMGSSEFQKESDGDDPIIKDIIESLTKYEENLVFDQLIESLVPFKRLDKEAVADVTKEEPYFVSISLFEFPYIIDIN